MNVSIIRYILGHIIKLEGFFMLLPCLIAMIFHEKELFTYLAMSVVCILLGSLLTLKKASNTVFYLKEGCIATVLSWVALSFFGALPFVITGEIPSFTDAMFETVSGFTTTGASILSNVEALSHTSLFWRSFTHWIGGMGVLVFLLAIVPLSGGSNMNLMRAESPGPSVGKLVPKMRYTARILYIIYFVLTIIELVALLFVKMPWFDALCISIGTAGTGGFGILNSSCAAYSASAQWIITIFMILFSINFNAYYLILFGQIKNALKMEEVRAFLIIVFTAIVFITWDISSMFNNLFEAITAAAFQVGSIVSSTGFATTDFDAWPGFSKTILVLLMFIGACAGSTGGGIKVSRIMIYLKQVGKELMQQIHPRRVHVLKMDGKEIPHATAHSCNVLLMTYVVVFIASYLLVSLDGFDTTTNFTAIVATLNNIGPGLNMVGAVGNFSAFSDFSKFILMFDMLAGRLEIIPMLLLFYPSTWKK